MSAYSFYRRLTTVVSETGKSLKTLVETTRQAVLAILLTTLAATSVCGQINRNPELQSRALAWTEFDGSYIVNPHSRAEMLNFYWTVLARPYPAPEWTGSINPVVHGSINELLRQRELAQLNAFRAMTGAPPAREDLSRAADVQALATIRLLDQLDPSRGSVNPSKPGYTVGAAEIHARAPLAGFSLSMGGSSPITDAYRGVVKTDMESHIQPFRKLRMLDYWNDEVGLGVAYGAGVLYQIWHQPAKSPLDYTKAISPDAIVAWPPPGYYPRRSIDTPAYAHRSWVFAPAAVLNLDMNWQATAEVVLTAGGKAIPARNVQKAGRPDPLSWDVHFSDLPSDLTQDLPIEVEIRNVRMLDGAFRTFRYTVTLFDESRTSREGLSAVTPLSNISTRAVVGEGDNVTIAGLVIDGVAPVRVAFRAQGPGLAAFGVQRLALKPTLSLYNSRGEILGSNAGWRNHQDWRLLESYGVSPARDDEPGIVATLWPGSYTVVLSDSERANGVGIIEAFNIDGLSSTKLLNLSTRGMVGQGEEQMIAGFALTRRATILIRTQGPTLARFGVSGAVSDTFLTVVAQSDGRQIAVNDDWQTIGDSPLHTSARGFAPADPREAALVLTLEPGAYTALVSAKGASGVGIVELFQF